MSFLVNKKSRKNRNISKQKNRVNSVSPQKKSFRNSSFTQSQKEGIICSFPPNKDKPRQMAVFVSDYLTLRPKSFINMEIIDFKLRLLISTKVVDENVLLLTYYEALKLTGGWSDSNEFMKKLVNSNFFENLKGLVVLPWCEKGHFFTVVGVCGVEYIVFTMESVGGYEEPTVVPKLQDFLASLRFAKGLPELEIGSFGVDMPKQLEGSNDCGIFMLEMIERIATHPTEFLTRFKEGIMAEWFDTRDVQSRRREIAETLQVMGEEQRQVGQLHDDMPPLVLPNFWI